MQFSSKCLTGHVDFYVLSYVSFKSYKFYIEIKKPHLLIEGRFRT